MRVVVTGSREFRDPLTASAAICRRIARLPSTAVLIHGDAQGADRLAGDAAEKDGIDVVKYPAHWEVHSEDCWCRGHGYCREAGKRRNLAMLDLKPDLVIAFWNGHSGGTKHTIKNAKERGLPLEVHRLD